MMIIIIFIQSNLFSRDFTAINKGHVETKNLKVKESNLQEIG